MIGKKLRKVWHDVFVKMNNKPLFKFADTCQSVVTSIDLNDKNRTFAQKARFVFHMSVCQACMNYYRFSKSVSTQMKRTSSLKPPSPPTDLKSLQERLMSEIAKKKD